MQKECVKICKECSKVDQHSETGFSLQGKISRGDIEYVPLCRTFEFRQSEKESCKNNDCPSKARESTLENDLRPVHDFSFGLYNTPPILVLHCKPYLSEEVRDTDGFHDYYLSGKVTRLEHSMAFSSYRDRSLDPNTIDWTFYHLYGVIIRQGDYASMGHYVCAFEQRQSGRWVFFDDFTRHTEELSRSRLDDKIEELQKGSGRIFMLMYPKLFQVPVRLLKRITSSSSAIALQNQQSQEESVEPGAEEAGDLEIGESGLPETGDVEEEFFTPEEGIVGDEDLLGSEPDTGKTRSKTQGAADGGHLQGGPSSSETRTLQAEQSIPTEPLAKQNVDVEGHTESSIPEPVSEQARGEQPGAADNVSQKDATDLDSQTSQVEQLLPRDLSTEQGVEVEADPGSSTAKTDTEATGSRAQAETSSQKYSQEGTENGEMTSSQQAYEIVGTEIQQPSEKQTNGKVTQRAMDKELDEDKEMPASTTGVNSSTQPKKNETKSRATKRTRKDASDEHEDEKAGKPALASNKRAKTVDESFSVYGGRETRSRARAKRDREEIPDVDKIENGQTVTSKPATTRAKTTKDYTHTGKAQSKSKTGGKK